MDHYGLVIAAVGVWNTVLIAVAGYFIRRWMGVVEERGRINAQNISTNDERNKEKLAQVTAQTTKEIKDAIRENRTEYQKQSDEIKESIDKLAEHISIANGRTGKLEEKIAVQIALCKQRNDARRLTDPCGGSD